MSHRAITAPTPLRLASFAAAILATLALAVSAHPLAAQQQRAVLVTGATSGIGRATAELLAERGFFVYAGARKASDMEELNAIPNMQAIRLDVTIQEDIDAAVETVRAEGRGLYGLINNAGVGVLGPLIEMEDEDFHFQQDVNVYGPFRVTKAFAPLIIESQGRISTTGSISGMLTWPFGGAYTVSKHAVEAFSETLAQELAPFGVQVSVVEPGNFDSRIYESIAARWEELGRSTEGSRYGSRVEDMIRGAVTERVAEEPTAVAEAFFEFMTTDDPKGHYLVVPNQREAEITVRAMLQRLVEVNRDQPFSYTREELIHMLDESLFPNSASGQEASPTEPPIASLDAYWAEVSRTVEEGDFEGYSDLYHADAVLVSSSSGNSYPIASALAGWEQGFVDTREGRASASVDFRFTERLNDGTTAHETGIFNYRLEGADGQVSDQFIHFEALLVHRGGWVMMMEFQKESATAEEWEAASTR